MSSILYSLGRWSFRHRRRVLALWLIVFAVAGGSAALFNKGTDNTFSIPGTESQAALDQLAHTFPQVSGTSAQIVVVAPDSAKVTDPDYRAAVKDALGSIRDIAGVSGATSPYSDTVKGLLSDDHSAAIIQVQLKNDATTVTDATKNAITRQGTALGKALPASATVSVGGQLFANSIPTVSATEAVGLVIALLVLFLVFRSFLAAGMPLVTAILGVGISLCLIFVATIFGSVSSTTPLLALMLGLAVGIDYALFIISRHQEQLKGGLDPEESAARATATSGSAVIFAGLTVLIALVGLSIARIPFLTTMGIAAAGAVALAVLIALTLTPAFLGFAGARLAPSARSRARAESRAAAKAKRTGTAAKQPGGFFRGWVRAATRFPVVTILVVIGVIALAAGPALSLRLALPDAGALPAENSARQTYDLVSQHFGPGFNGPLIVTGTIVSSDDPVKLMDDLGDDIADIQGVKTVLLSTPNATADTGIVQVVPTTGPDATATTDLVNRIRAQHDHFEKKYGVDLSVTGQTAVGIDISTKLGNALVPFGIFVVGLSLILLAMVFRSIAVPIKATVGFLLSVVAAFGAVGAVFDLGIGADLLNVSKVGPVISFLPIILMGVLFGLAMDYEVFLVSRMREEYVHNGRDAKKAIEAGFVGSAKVVTAAAIIMLSVFASFIPEGDTSIKPIAVGLATGVFVDAFIVRMTLVPAVMALLGQNAWWIPRWLDRVLPVFDVEGEAIGHELALASWPEGGAALAARDLRFDGPDGPVFDDVTTTVPAGGILIVESREHERATALLLALAGRLPGIEGDLKVADLVLPSRASAVRSQVGFGLLATADDPLHATRRALHGAPPVVALDGSDTVIDPDARRALAEEIATAADDARADGHPLTLVLSTADAERVLALLPADAGPVTTLALASTSPLKGLAR